MTKKELSKEYAFNTPLKTLGHLHTDLGAEMALTNDIRKAYEDGYDKAVELACRFFYERNYSSKFIKNFKEIMEEGADKKDWPFRP